MPRTGAEDRRRETALGKGVTPPVAECYARPKPPATRTRLPSPGQREPS